MKAVVKKWGNSAAVRLPTAIMESAKLKLDQELDIREENGVIVIEPAVTDEATLAELVAAITDENTHDAVDFGADIGEEFEL